MQGPGELVRQARGGDNLVLTPGAKVASWFWAISAPCFFGFFNWLLFIVPAVRLRRRVDVIAEVYYAATFVLAIASSGSSGGWGNVWAFFWFTSWVVGTIHAFVVRRRTFGRPMPSYLADVGMYADPVAAQNAMAVNRALGARDRRLQAREILARDPRLASDLGIGRPDLRRGYDDGGLVDLNSAPAGVLTSVLHLDDASSQRLVSARATTAGFTSLEEVGVLANLTPDLVERIRDRSVLSPRV